MEWKDFRKFIKNLNNEDAGLLLKYLVFKGTKNEPQTSLKIQSLGSEILNRHKITISHGPYPFHKFWEDYGLKINKKPTQKLYSKLSYKEQEIIMNNLPKYIDSTPGGRYRVTPDKYIRYEKFYDEIPNRTNAKKRTYSGNNPQEVYNSFD